MWRRWCSCASLLSKKFLINGTHVPPPASTRPIAVGFFSTPSTEVRLPSAWLWTRVVSFSSTIDSSESVGAGGGEDEADGDGGTNNESEERIFGKTISYGEAKRLLRLVDVEELKKKLRTEGKKAIGFTELIEACKSLGVATSHDEAAAFARVLDEAGVILLFRNKVYLHPDEVVDVVRRVGPVALMLEEDPTMDELNQLYEQKNELDILAHKQVRRILWTGLGISVLQVSLFFRLTFWEFSWDVMEPIAFFTTTTGLIMGYAYFMFTSRDPTYQDLMKRLFLARQRKLFKKNSFDVCRFKELQKKYKKTPFETTSSIKNRVGLDLDLDD